jgi:hypothetical protein
MRLMLRHETWGSSPDSLLMAVSSLATTTLFGGSLDGEVLHIDADVDSSLDSRRVHNR